MLFYFVETFAEHTVAESLTYHSIGVDGFDEVEGVLALVFAAEDHYHGDILFGVPSFAVEDSDATVHLVVDGIGNQFVLLGYDHELDSLSGAVDNIVEHDASDESEAYAVDDDFGALEQDVAAADDTDVDHLKSTADAHARIFVDESNDDVGAACGAVVCEDNAESCSGHESSDEHMHECVFARSDERECLEERLHKSDDDREHGDTDDGAYGKLAAKSLERDEQQDAVDDPDGYGRVPSYGIIDESRDTCDATHDDAFGKDEGRVSNAIDHYAEKNEYVVFDI